MPSSEARNLEQRVLVVEDHALVRQSLLHTMEREGIGPVVEANSSAEALALAQAGGFALAILDLRLADGSGLDLAPKLKAAGVARILVITASDDHFTVRAAFTAGADGYLLKSSSHLLVAQAIRQVLNGELFTDPAVASLLVQSLRSPTAIMEELTGREKELLGLVADGLTNKDIATRMFVSTATIKSHLARIGRKLGATDRSEMVATAMRSGLLN